MPIGRGIAPQYTLNLVQDVRCHLWVLRQQNVASAIVGASRPEQVHANASASGIALSDDVLSAIDAALGEVVAR